MRRFYQESWQGIPFTSFSHLSFFHLADPKFYSTFYEALFRRYKDWEDLPPKWRKSKTWDARWLADKIAAQMAVRTDSGPFRVLSIGSGVGFMEKTLLDLAPDIELHINEPSTVGLKWLRRILPSERIYIGMPATSLPSDITYDLIYLSAVDYGLPNHEFSRLLDILRVQLVEGGELVCISASLLEEDSFIGSFVNSIKNVLRGMLHYLGVRRQQFWGWRRTRQEYLKLFADADFVDIKDGFLDDGFESYWISGK